MPDTVALDPEREIVATLTKDSALAAYYKKGLKEYNFADAECSRIFEWVIRYYRVHGKLEHAPTYEVLIAEFPNYGDLIQGTKGAEATYLSDRLMSDYVKRQASEVLKTFVPKMLDDPKATVEGIRDSFSSIMNNSIPRGQRFVFGEDVEYFEQLSNEAISSGGAPYPFLDMTKYTGGMKLGELTVLVAATGKGKTVFACATALEAARAGWDVYFATLEMPPIQIMQRLELMEANKQGMTVSPSLYTQGRATPEQQVFMKRAYKNIAEMGGRIVVDQPDLSDRTPSGLVSNCKMSGCNFIIIDQLDFILKPKADSKTEAIGRLMYDFKNEIASPSDGRKLPLLLLHQLNREGSKSQSRGGVGVASDVADSASIERFSDTLWGLGRTKEEEENEIMNIATMKSRRFGATSYKMRWETEDRYFFELMRDGNGFPVKMDVWGN